MYQFARIGTYKTKDPQKTIKDIKNIFNKIGLSYVYKITHKSKGIYAIRLFLDKKLDFIFSNGKGINKDYALASAFAEMLERIQNLKIFDVFFLNNEILAKIIFPDTKKINIKYFIKNKTYKYFWQSLFINNNEKIKFLKSIMSCKTNIEAIPFYDLNRKKIIYLPKDVIYFCAGSNGMCAGNSKEEALIQGLGEILERYVYYLYYFNSIVFPTIPDKYLEKLKQFKYIKELRKNGYEVFVKDCSLNGKYPVVGLAIKKNNNALFKLGSSLNYEIALERCITELIQTHGISGLKEINLYPIIPRLKKQNKKSNESSILKAVVYEDLFDNKNKFSEKNLFNIKDEISNKSLHLLLNIINKEKKQIYIRDVSFLGFPTYFIYIPGLSEPMKYDEKILWENLIELKNIRKLFYKKQKLNKLDKIKIFNFLKVIGANNLYFLEDYLLSYIHTIPLTHEQCLKQSNKLKIIIKKGIEYFDEVFKGDCVNCLKCTNKDKCIYDYYVDIVEKIVKQFKHFIVDQNNTGTGLS